MLWHGCLVQLAPRVYVHPVSTLRLLHAAPGWPTRAGLQSGPSADNCCAAVSALRHDASQLHRSAKGSTGEGRGALSEPCIAVT
jgi:hypothetical protein